MRGDNGLIELIFGLLGLFGLGVLLIKMITKPSFGAKVLKKVLPYALGIGLLFLIYPPLGIIAAVIGSCILLLIGTVFAVDGVDEKTNEK